MEANPEHIMKTANMLKILGLSSYEAQAFASLVYHGVANADTIADTAGIPRTSAYKVMESLVARGFARETEGDINLIRESGNRLKNSMIYAGLSPEVEFIWASDVVANPSYWELLLQTAKNSSLLRIRRSLPIMGRTEEDADKDFSKYIYPLMQVTDVFYLNSDLALGGTDQRHAYMLARDIAEKMGRKKPVLMEMPLIASLKGRGRMDDFKKMSR